MSTERGMIDEGAASGVVCPAGFDGMCNLRIGAELGGLNAVACLNTDSSTPMRHHNTRDAMPLHPATLYPLRPTRTPITTPGP
eukprot:11504-Eustigmatos_ZCMA.PRE.1